jgi:hypothetical protein
MPNVHELIRDHVTLSIRCLDRLYLHAYMPKLQTSGRLCYFLRDHLGHPIPSPALFAPMLERFVDAIKRCATTPEIALFTFDRGQRKDNVVAAYRAQRPMTDGVVVIGVAQEKMRAFEAHKLAGRGKVVSFDFSRQSVAVNHYYFYVQDADWGPAFRKMGTYLRYPIKLCLNGHEWVKQQLRREGVAFDSLDNGFLACADPTRRQAICERLGPADVQAFCDRWAARLPAPVTAGDRAAGYTHRLARQQVEVRLTQVFARPVQGRHLKEQRALRTETTINNPKDFYVAKAVSNLTHLRDLGDQANRKLLDVERISHQCLLTQDALDRLQQPTIKHGQRTSALRFGDPRVMALVQAITWFAHLPRAFRNRDLRPRVEALLGRPYSIAQMTYDLRRLRLKGVIHRIPTTHRYTATSYGLKVAFFYAKLYLGILRPEWVALLPADDQNCLARFAPHSTPWTPRSTRFTRTPPLPHDKLAPIVTMTSLESV